MIDPNEHEVAALRQASAVGGEYIESLGRSDLAQWSAQEWTTLIDIVVTAFQDHLRDAYIQYPPF